MNRRALFSAALSTMTASSLPLLAQPRFAMAAAKSDFPPRGKPVKPPAHGPLQVAFVVGPETVLIDVAGPWEAFTDTMLNVNTFLVAPRMQGADLGGIHVRPDHTFDNAPQPNVIVVPATKNLPESVAWVKHPSRQADITMSVCVGAFLVAKTGLFDGQYATTHHSAYDEFARNYPKVKLVRGPRFVEDYNVSSSGGETSGIALGLRVVERYFGTKAANVSAEGMEYVPTARPWN